MKTFRFLIVITMLSSVSLFAQKELNNYKYLIIPEKFDFQKTPNQHRINLLSKFILEKSNFSVFMDNEPLPADALEDNCLVLRLHAVDNSGIFKTKIFFQFKDCLGNVVYFTEEGISREKTFVVAYNEAVRKAFNSLGDYKHEYNKQNSAITTVKSPEKTEKQNKKVKEAKTIKPKKENGDQLKPQNTASNILYAQKINNGFQLVDRTPKLVYKIKNTSLENVFLVEGKQAILYKKGNEWIMEYYEDENLKIKQLTIKF